MGEVRFGRATVTRFTSHALRSHVAHEMDLFTDADIPEMASSEAESEHWSDNYFLNSLLRGSFSPPANGYAQHFLRRTEAAFTEHERARVATVEFLVGSRQSPSRYLGALTLWEHFLGHSWNAYAVLRGFVTDLSGDEVPVFKRGDGSLEQRLNLVYNAVKHVEKRIAAGQLPGDSSNPVWLSNRGVECTDCYVTWPETGAILGDLGKWANLLSDPVSLRDRLIAHSE